MLLNHPRHISSDCYTCAYRDTTVKTSTLELYNPAWISTENKPRKGKKQLP